MEATTTKRQHTAHPISHYWSLVKDMDNSQKLELITMLVQSIQPAVAMKQETGNEEHTPKTYTIEELHERIAVAEANIAAGKTTSHDESMRRWKEKITRKKQELEMVEAV